MSGQRIGLTLGKFAPFHAGHQFVVECALAEMDRVIVVIYEAPEVTSTPLAIRAGWIRELYPMAEVIEAWGGPTEVGSTRAIEAAHERFLLEVLGDRRITHFYSSEPYGAHVSRALGAVDRRVDPERTHRPVSGTAVREDPHGLRHLVPARVYRDLIAKVVLLGAPSTGKTTLAEALAASYRTSWVPEYGRTYWERHQRDRRLTPQQLLEIARRHLESEEIRLRDANRFLFSDTNALTTAVFSREYHGAVSAELEALADAATRRYDLALLCATDVPYADTPDRDGPAHRATFQRRVVDDLHARRVPYVVVRGTVAERVTQVRAALARFSKFGNPFDVVDGGRA